jgi:hypothetical protein
MSQNKRAEVAKWLTPEEEGDWAISHTNPMKYAVREIAPWTDARLLSEVIEQDAYELKPIGTKKLVQPPISLVYALLEAEPSSQSRASAPPVPHAAIHSEFFR